jgi:hypothetical protein
MSWSDYLLPSSAQTSDEAAANLDRQTALFNARLAAREQDGTISDQQDASAHAFITGVKLEDQDAAAAQGFAEGWAQGWDNLKQTAKDATSALSPAIWGIVVLAGVGLFVWAGGLGIIKGVLKK